MKKDGKYRFSLQFDNETEEKRKVGDFLEHLGNRKSAVIILAVAEYLQAHPEIAKQDSRIQIQIEPSLSKTELEKLIRTIIDEKLSAIPHTNESTEIENEPVLNDDDIEEMLQNLDLFGG